ncbi:MAG: hypothetical protein PHS54_07430 [Clostridia bacterium]|nr:hypothetical protein [Clostridia bacterium]
MNNSNNFSFLAVGQPLELFKTRPEFKYQDGAVFECLQGGTFAFIIYMNKITEQEKEILRKNKIRVKIIREDDFLLTMINYVGTPLVFEMSFDPTLYKDGRFFSLSKSNLITIIGVDSSNNIIQTLRTVSTPPKLFGIWQKYWLKPWNISHYQEDFTIRYKEWVDNLDTKYTVLQLWERGEYIGVMGESY